LHQQAVGTQVFSLSLSRKTICFSKSEEMHDITIGLLINKVEFGLDIHA